MRPPKLPERENLSAALAAADLHRLSRLADAISARARVEPLAPPGEGLMLLQVRDSVAGARFYLGEISVATVHLRLSEGARIAEGGATLMSDNLELVTRIAVLDAALAGGWPEAGSIADLVAEGETARERIEAERGLVLERTRVDFELLAGASDGDA